MLDDVRHLIVAGHAAPWAGREGLTQQRLGVENACGLSRRLLEHGFEVVLADVVTLDTAALYRDLLPDCLLVRVHVSFEEARRRAGTRPVFLTDAEFAHLHEQDHEDPPPADHHLNIAAMSVLEQVTAIAALWQLGQR